MSLTKPILVLTCILVLVPITMTYSTSTADKSSMAYKTSMTYKSSMAYKSSITYKRSMTYLKTCPSKEDIFPCSCREKVTIFPNFTYGYDIFVTCRGLNNEDDLVNAARNLRGHDLYEFKIEHSNFNFIPNDAFKGAKIYYLDIENSTLMALTDTDEAFVGLEGMEWLRIASCDILTELDWSIFRNLKSLDTLRFDSSRLETIGKELMALTRVRFIEFQGAGIASIDDQAFSTMKDITYLELQDNEIQHLKRTMLPNPAVNLHVINITNNQIEEFPEDMFTNIPNLKVLDIGYNKILVINENTFSPAWEQLNKFYTTGNPLWCDCRISWLLEKRLPQDLEGSCASPFGLRGHRLKDLKSGDLRCYK